MKTKSRLLGGIAHGALVLGMAHPALAQQSGYDLGMILLTGEKDAKTIESTATSVQVITGDEVKPQSGDISEALKTVPNLLDVGTGVAPTIRGIESQGAQEGAVAFFAGTTPRATVNVDGHYQNYYEYVNGGTSLWDIDTVEVYRGRRPPSRVPTRSPARRSSTPRTRPSNRKPRRNCWAAATTPAVPRWR